MVHKLRAWTQQRSDQQNSEDPKAIGECGELPENSEANIKAREHSQESQTREMKRKSKWADHSWEGPRPPWAGI